MRQALLILRKDLRHLWLPVGGFVALAMIYGFVDSQVPRNAAIFSAGMMFGAVLWVYASLLVVMAVHEDRLTGASQFWVTRPYSWRSLLLAKFLFILLCVNLPVLVAQLVAMTLSGLSARQYAADLLWRHVGGLAGFLFPCAALAAVTGSMVQVVLGALGGYIGTYAIAMTLAMAKGGVISLAPFNLVANTTRAMVLIATAVAVCLIQYSLRRTSRARTVLAVGWVGSYLCLIVFPWGLAFALMESRPQAVAASVGQLSVDSTRELPFLPFVPIHISGIPYGMQMYSERIQLSLTAPAGERWESGWDSQTNISRDDKMPGNPRILADDAVPYRLNIHRGLAYYETPKNAPVHLRIRVAFALLGRPTRLKPEGSNRTQSVPGGGFCTPAKGGGSVQVSRTSGFRIPAAYTVRFQPLPSGEATEDETVSDLIGATGPPSIFSIWENPIIGLAYSHPTGPVDVHYETRQVVAHFERDLDVPAVRSGVRP